MKDSGKKALLVVSFGTTDSEGRKNSIESVEAILRTTFSDRRFYRAWTSGRILSILSKQDDHVDSTEEAILRMKKDGITDVLVQPTHILPGLEFEKIRKAFGACEAAKEKGSIFSGFQKVHIGRPLISTDGGDIKRLTTVLRKTLSPPKEKELQIFVGHGTEHKANEIYRQMECEFRKEGFDNVMFATLEGPFSIMEQGKSGRNLNPLQMERIRSLHPSRIDLIPFLFVCGEHARKDIGGKAGSILSLLKQAGYDTGVVMKGLGEYPSVQYLYVEHARDAAGCTIG
jgi:sirohydrochlorin cobaltochelatase